MYQYKNKYLEIEDQSLMIHVSQIASSASLSNPIQRRWDDDDDDAKMHSVSNLALHMSCNSMKRIAYKYA